MAINRIPIHLTVNYEGEKYELETYVNEYRNLMMLLFDKIYIQDFGECKGMGRCGTCAVKITGLPKSVVTLDRNGERTLSKLGMHREDVHLSCQILVDEQLENIAVEVIGSESIEE